MSRRAVIYIRTSSETQGVKSSSSEQESDCQSPLAINCSSIAHKGRFTRTATACRKTMPIRIDPDQRAGRDTLPDLETSFEQRL